MSTTTLDYLIPELRLKIGDINPESYRYLDEWLLVALGAAVKISYRYLGDRYWINDFGEVSRNPNKEFEYSEDYGVIQKKDEPVILVLASLSVLGGSLENSAWSTGSWRDAEISVSNIESGRLREGTLKSLRDELKDLVLPPTKRLGKPRKNSLPGYTTNPFERNTNEP